MSLGSGNGMNQKIRTSGLLREPSFWEISYPNEAAGWEKGVYQERKPVYSAAVSQVLREEADCYEITSRSWTETESSGFGVFSYMETACLRLESNRGDYQIAVQFCNPGEFPYEVSVLADTIKKADHVELPVGEERTVRFSLCAIEMVSELICYVESEAESRSEAGISRLWIRSIEITPFERKSPYEKPVIFLASDSTVQSYDEFHYPQTGWGQVFYRFFAGADQCREAAAKVASYPQCRDYELPDILIENRAIGARSSRSFVQEGKLDELLSIAERKDVIFFQWGHNDATAIRPNRYVTPETYAQYLTKYVRACKERGIGCVLVTPCVMRNCDSNEGRFTASFAEYAEAMRQTAQREQVCCLDLNARSLEILQSLGAERSRNLYLWAAPGAYPESAYANGVSDNAHLQEYGACRFAQLVAQEWKRKLEEQGESFWHSLLRPELIIEDPQPLTEKPQEKGGTRPESFVLQELHVEKKQASFLLNWDEVEGAVSYRIYRKGSVDFAFSLLRELSAEEKQQQAVHPFVLPALDVYQIYVTAVFLDQREGERSRILELRA